MRIKSVSPIIIDGKTLNKNNRSRYINGDRNELIDVGCGKMTKEEWLASIGAPDKYELNRRKATERHNYIEIDYISFLRDFKGKNYIKVNPAEEELKEKLC